MLDFCPFNKWAVHVMLHIFSLCVVTPPRQSAEIQSYTKRGLDLSGDEQGQYNIMCHCGFN